MGSLAVSVGYALGAHMEVGAAFATKTATLVVVNVARLLLVRCAGLVEVSVLEVSCREVSCLVWFEQQVRCGQAAYKCKRLPQMKHAIGADVGIARLRPSAEKQEAQSSVSTSSKYQLLLLLASVSILCCSAAMLTVGTIGSIA